MTAREYFEQVRDAVLELRRSEQMLERLRATEAVSGLSLEPRGSGGASDAMGKVDRRLDFESRLQARVDEADELLDAATAVLYGEDGRGGIAKEKGNRYADVLCMAYCQAMPWPEIAEVMQCTQQWCRELSRAAFRYIDRVGFAHLREG